MKQRPCSPRKAAPPPGIGALSERIPEQEAAREQILNQSLVLARLTGSDDHVTAHGPLPEEGHQKFATEDDDHDPHGEQAPP